MERSMQPLDGLLRKDSDTPSLAKPPESIRSISAAMGYQDTPDQPRLDDRHRRRTLFKTCGVDILWFGTAREMIHAVAGAVTGERSLVSFYSSFLMFLLGHRNAYEKRQILHGDVSDGNTLIILLTSSELMPLFYSAGIRVLLALSLPPSTVSSFSTLPALLTLA
jgi:hypothetical protein